jgi:hypothetical protein
MSYEAGSAFITIQPSLKGFSTTIDRFMVDAGAQAGDVFGESWKETVKKVTGETQAGPSDSESTKKGESSGGKFATAFKARLDAALKSLPDASVKLDDKEAEAKLAEIRARMLTLRDLSIGVDIKDVDALAAIEVLQVDLSELAVRSPSIRVHVDAAEAIVQLEAVKIASDEASGESTVAGSGGGGLSGVGSSLGSLATSGPIAIGVILLLGTALIPIGALAAAAAIGLAGMAVAATAGIGAFGLVAIPVFTQVSTAMQQITSDQNAVNRATSTAQKNTALTHLRDDLNNLSPVVRTITLGMLDAKTIFSDWSAQFSPDVIAVFNSALKILKPLLDALTPLVHAGAGALQGFFKAIGDAIASPGFQKFIGWLATQVGPAVASFTKTFIGFGKGFAHLLENSGPLIKAVEKFLPKMAEAFDKFATSQALKDFVKWITEHGPGIFDDVKKIIKGIVDLIVALAPVGLFVLHAIADVVTAFTTVQEGLIKVWHWIWDNVLNPLISGISDGVTGAVNALKIAWDAVWGGLKSVANQAWQDMIPIVDGVISVINDLITALDLVPGVNIPHIPTIHQTAPAPTGARINHSGRAAGGPVQAGVPYTVGELGREMFVPAVNGTIIPHNVLASLHQGSPRQGHGINIQSATFKNEADIDVLTRKADFAMASGRL